MDSHVIATIDELLQRLKQMEDMQDIKQIEALNTEKAVLLRKIELCDRAREGTADVILEASKMISLLQSINNTMVKKQATEDRKWLAYWGINDKKETIFEMQQLK